MKKSLCILGLILFSVQSHANQYALSDDSSSVKHAYLQQGTQEIGIQGSLDLDYVDDYLLDLNTSYGYFVRDKWEIGGELDLTISDNAQNYQIGAFTEYNFTNTSLWVPYLGVGAQYAYSDINDNSDSAFNFQVSAGMKYFLHPQIALAAEVNYNLATEDIYADGDGEAKDDKTQFLIGTRFYF
ncbi:hypothetical protein C9I98_07200 [Photobacterium sanctipauli]|uniref:Outer membrane protein beta-barrel domain-containing protein n=1 Tax=Photobacterium sanctipauli TaxID=1342794 RepID=A0A2T3NWP9_9GAMM|nr:outer membrane beta-barrel protein [Photobacterium sanctipauli]PSW20628.1 hypothetical protein C9I98_07200 [Photobacterium sanctipauli]